MMLRSFIMAIALFASGQAVAQQVTVYVSPAGNDANDGMSPTKPFATPERAEAEIVKQGFGTVYLMDGLYNRGSVLMLKHGPTAQKWTAYQGATPIFDGGDRTLEAIRIEADHVTINGLTIRNFAHNGIGAVNAPDVAVTNNRISNIPGDQWGFAGVLVLANSPNAVIAGNVISNTGYAGIEVYGEPGADTSGTLIEGNTVSQACRVKDDCGAIYVSGRTTRSDGTIIRNNHIHDYGAPALQKAFGIYLDDFASNMQLVGNTIDGPGICPIFVHGGRGNAITGNTFGLSAGQHALWIGNQIGVRQSDMGGNRFENNTVSGAASDADFVKVSAPGKALPFIRNNQIAR